MFVVRRIADGKYRRNSSGSICRKMRPDEWVTDLKDVKPYRTVAAAKNSVGGPIQNAAWRFNQNLRNGALDNDCCKAVEWTYSGYKNKCQHFNAEVFKAEREFSETYEILPVKLTLVKIE